MPWSIQIDAPAGKKDTYASSCNPTSSDYIEPCFVIQQKLAQQTLELEAYPEKNGRYT